MVVWTIDNQGLDRGLLGGEAGGEVRRWIARLGTLGLFSGSKDAIKVLSAKVIDGVPHCGDVRQVDAHGDDIAGRWRETRSVLVLGMPGSSLKSLPPGHLDGQLTRARRLLEAVGEFPGTLSRDHPARRARATAASCELTPSF